MVLLIEIIANKETRVNTKGNQNGTYRYQTCAPCTG